MSKLTLALLAALFCIILADVSGEQQSIKTDTLSEVLTDHNLVKREAEPGKKKKKKNGDGARKKRNKKKNCKGKKCRKSRKQSKKSAKSGKGRKTKTAKKQKCPKGKKGKDCRKARKQSLKKSGKGGKASDKKKKTARKQKKCPKGKQGKDCRKARRGPQRTNGNGGKASPRQFTTCFEKLYKYTAKLKKANNIQKQFIRVNGSKGTITNKKDKKGTFNSTFATLNTALGGNKTNPKCAASSRAFNTTLDTLDKCESDIEASCTFSINDTRLAEMEQCYKDAESFYDPVDKCLANGNKNTTAACSCFDGLDLDALLAKVTACDLSSDNNAVKKEKQKCKKSFGACKTAQIDSVEFVDTCKEQLKCGGVSSKEEAEKQLKALTPLSDALKQTGFADALKKLGLDSGTGSDGVLPTRRANNRVNRQAATDSDGCNKVLDNWKSFNKTGDTGVPGTDGDIDEDNISATVKTLDTLNNSPTLEDDLNGCQKETGRQVTVTLVIVQIRFYVFWCGWFQVTVVEIKITIIQVTFGITTTTSAPPTLGPTTAVVSTVAPSGRNRKKFFQKNLIA